MFFRTITSLKQPIAITHGVSLAPLSFLKALAVAALLTLVFVASHLAVAHTSEAVRHAMELVHQSIN